MIPLWLSTFVVKTGLINLKTNMFKGKFKKSTLQIVQGLTKNKDLQTCFTYCWGDYGTQPSRSNFMMHALLLRHYAKVNILFLIWHYWLVIKFILQLYCFLQGAGYPIGGASEFAFNIIPVIERSGGKVFVKADVEQILYNGRKVHNSKN